MGECVRVIVRARPMNNRENSMKCKTVVAMDPSKAQCQISNPAEPNGPPKNFTFDSVYYVDSTAESIYNEIVYPLVENVLEGYNGTVFAYGQTGSGKTFTMQGPDSIPAQRGIISRTFEHIFEATATSENTKYLVHASYLEIYNEEVRDLLGQDLKEKLEIKEHPEKGVYVGGLSMHAVHNVKECEILMEKGFKNRHVGATLMNTDSSRSHSIFTIHLEMMEEREDGEHIKTAKLHLVDLAGSERQAKTGATGARFKEATKINLSLSALGNVISALVDGKSKHIPYRDSKLTRLLQDSLGGNTKTIMIACMSPADNNYDESLSTLRYANRAKNIKNKPKINEDPKDALLREYQEEIERLKALLPGGAATEAGAPPAAGVDIENERTKLRQEFEEQMNELKHKYQQEQSSNAKLQEDLDKLKTNYDDAVNRVNHGQTAATASTQSGLVAPTSSPTHGPQGVTDTAETMKKLEMLKEQMVGGEQADNNALKKKRQDKKLQAQKRMEHLAEVLSTVDADDPMLHVYNTTQDKLNATMKQLDKTKKRNKALENEIQDLQSEFELDRIDYLDTIRRQDQQLKLMQQLLEKIQPCIRRDSNYANLERIKKEAVWDEDLQKWHLPDVSVSKTQLPTGGIMPGGRIAADGGLSPRQVNGYSNFQDDGGDNKLKFRLEQSSAENLANNYFKPMRSSNIITKTQNDKNRTLTNGSTNFPNQPATWDNLMNGVIYTNDIYERPSTASVSPSNGYSVKKPQRLEALDNPRVISSAKKARKKKQ